MPDFQKPVPSYLIEKRNIVNLILFTALFALIFINIYSPFGADKWFNLTSIQFLTFSSLVILPGVMVVVISRIIMYQLSKKYTINLTHFLLWITAEIFAMALFYSMFQKIFLNDTRELIVLVKMSARNTALVLLLPYSVAWLYLSWKEKKEQIELFSDTQRVQDTTPDMIPFYDEKSVLRFSVKIARLLYLEASENYITIYYLNKGVISKYLLRATMKRMEENLTGTSILRCHRSYMVNFEKVKVIRKDKDGLKLQLDHPEIIDIPISKTYSDNVMQKFVSYSDQ